MPSFETLTFLWPSMLWLTASLPVLVFAHGRLLRWRRRDARAWRGLRLVGGGGAAGFRRWLPASLLLAALALLLVAVARPKAVLSLPIHAGTVLLAVDISGSMRATDAAPSRLEAGREALARFIADRPSGVRVGIVAFANSALLVHPPGDNLEAAIAALRRLEPQRGTALGSGMLLALATLLPGQGIEKIDEAASEEGTSRPRAGAVPKAAGPSRPIGGGTDARDANDVNVGRPAVRREPGSNRTAALVLLSDGQGNVGPDPRLAADVAAAHGVRVFAIGAGTPDGETVSADGMTMRVRLDEALMQHIAQTTGGAYYRADDASKLPAIYRQIERGLTFGKREAVEITRFVIALGALLAAAAAITSLSWRGRIA